VPIHIITIMALSFSLSANAALLSIDSSFGADSVTRDTATGLDWLDVTQTRGLSYDQVNAQMVSGGLYEGWRYATVAELDQLIVNFGYSAVNQNCSYTAIHCDLINVTQAELVETMIRMLGDTYDATVDQLNETADVSASGAGYTFGLLGSQNRASGYYDAGLIYDRETILRSNGAPYEDDEDTVQSLTTAFIPSYSTITLGSFLVAPSPVPIPASVWLFASALLSLVGIKRKQAI